MTAPRRRWFRFSLRTLFVVVTALGCWLGYQVNWIRERREGSKWLTSHAVGGSIGYYPEPRPKLPWSLAIFGEQPIYKSYPIGALDSERNNLRAYRKRVAEIESLFPECQIIDIDDFDTDSEPDQP